VVLRLDVGRRDSGNIRDARQWEETRLVDRVLRVHCGFFQGVAKYGQDCTVGVIPQPEALIHLMEELPVLDQEGTSRMQEPRASCSDAGPLRG
jgi:hypothetical protein